MKFLSPRTHSIIGFTVGLALLIAPNIFGFSDVGGAAVMVPRIIGALVVLSELAVRGSFSGVGYVPMSIHLPVDIGLGLFLAVSPWLFGFTDEGSNAWVPHVLVGALLVGYAFVTRANENYDGNVIN